MDFFAKSRENQKKLEEVNKLKEAAKLQQRAKKEAACAQRILKRAEREAQERQRADVPKKKAKMGRKTVDASEQRLTKWLSEHNMIDVNMQWKQCCVQLPWSCQHSTAQPENWRKAQVRGLLQFEQAIVDLGLQRVETDDILLEGLKPDSGWTDRRIYRVPEGCPVRTPGELYKYIYTMSKKVIVVCKSKFTKIKRKARGTYNGGVQDLKDKYTEECKLAGDLSNPLVVEHTKSLETV
eukprot:737291_1